jgi:UDP-N-acetyl-2-amino-2-deoxyglucuronate dehydrogenase
MFADVLAAVEGGGKPLIDGHEGRRSVELILAIYEAAHSGQMVQLPLDTDPPAIRKLHGMGLSD